MPNPLDSLTTAIGLPKGFLDALYPFSLYQTTPPNLNGLDRASGQGMPSMAPQPLGSPNPLAQGMPPAPGMGALMGAMGGGGGMPGMPGMPPMPGMGMPPGMGGMGGPPGMPPGMGGGMPPGMPSLPGQMGMPPGQFTPPSASPSPQLGAGNPIWPWLFRNAVPGSPIGQMIRRLGMPGLNPPGPGLSLPPPGTQPLGLPSHNTRSHGRGLR